MIEPKAVVPSRSEALGQALRTLRKLRGRRPGEMAVLLGISRRAYEYFEAGKGPLNVDRVHLFAQILDVDPFAILTAMEIRSPQFAVACADHKMMTLMMVAAQEFDAVAGADTARLNAATIIAGFTRVFDALAREAREGEDFAERWLGEAEPPAPSPTADPETPTHDAEGDPDPDSSDKPDG
ncbi:helix-turn-helix transcriptional regulator [Phenylobacterium sp.]|uniref:helix-turn-helix domain-containing protein n=1 Tax=Phenylobacterium sp. TaxID=1871053 RepID=UPI0011FFD11C|nr:helix-turn-helix transcriptional regulator [Phenylobacterium sp.]THD60593.1 MAG: XRE family transcriptional regulator [Phenylobacterium sp.]